jgi:chromatin structure-remodeling complex subunit RSC3/30
VILRKQKRQRPDNQQVFRVDRRISSTAAPSLSDFPTTKENSLCDQNIARWTAKENGKLRPGLLGLVSPKDIFSEYEDSLPVEEPGRLQGSTAAAGDSNQVLLGSQILSHLQKIGWFYEIIESKGKIAPGWVLGPPLTRMLCRSIEKMYDCAIRGSKDTNASILNLSRQIFDNTSEDIQTTSTMNVTEYFDSIAARWETIGLVFVLLGTALFHIPDDDPIFTHRNPWKLEKGQLRSIAVTVGETCWQFCNGTGTASDAFCWLTAQHLCLLTMMVGYEGN